MAKIEKYKFDPPDGFKDGLGFPNPTSETQVREQLQRLHDQSRDKINEIIETYNNSDSSVNTSIEEINRKISEVESSSNQKITKVESEADNKIKQLQTDTNSRIDQVEKTATDSINKLNSKTSELDTSTKELKKELDTKQEKLVAGANISIVGNTISATGGGSGGGGISQEYVDQQDLLYFEQSNAHAEEYTDQKVNEYYELSKSELESTKKELETDLETDTAIDEKTIKRGEEGLYVETSAFPIDITVKSGSVNGSGQDSEYTGAFSSGKIRGGVKTELFTDKEGGNLRIISPNGTNWELDAYNGNLRIVNSGSGVDGNVIPVIIDKNTGVITVRNRITGVSTPTANTDASNKQYVDTSLNTAKSYTDTSLATANKITTGTLAKGSISITLSDSRITTSSILSFYTSIYGVVAESVTVAAGKVTLTFPAQESAMTVGVRVDGSY